MNRLDPGYSAEADEIGKTNWHALLSAFDDASFYQTWSYGEKAWGAPDLSHLVLRREGRPVALAQLRVLHVPILRSGIAYLNWGPLWRPSQDRDHAFHLRNMARALRNEYVERRRLILRIQPKIIDSEENRAVPGLFLEEGYTQSPDPARTYLVDLRPSLERIRQNLSRSWKRSLAFAEKQNLIIAEASGPDQYGKILDIYSQMKTRKGFFGNTQIAVLRVQEDLPDELKLKILLCQQGDATAAALGWSSMGKISMPLIGATGPGWHKASFLLWWNDQGRQSAGRGILRYGDRASRENRWAFLQTRPGRQGRSGKPLHRAVRRLPELSPLSVHEDGSGPTGEDDQCGQTDQSEGRTGTVKGTRLEPGEDRDGEGPQLADVQHE
jgi:hypothetical protein